MPLKTDFNNDLAIVTGATGGIGRATSHTLADLGCSVAVHYNSAKEDAEQLVRELQAKGVRSHAFQADMGNYESVRLLHASVVATLGDPSILFLNAGTTHGIAAVQSMDQISIDVFEETWRANCGSAYLLTQLCMPALQRARFGRVIFCSSVAAFTGGVVGPHYASSKSALHGLIHWLSGALARSNAGDITVNGVAPALIGSTKMLNDAGSNEDLAKHIPLKRLGQPEEVAETVAWMVKTGYLTNKVVAIDGGIVPQ